MVPLASVAGWRIYMHTTNGQQLVRQHRRHYFAGWQPAAGRRTPGRRDIGAGAWRGSKVVDWRASPAISARKGAPV